MATLRSWRESSGTLTLGRENPEIESVVAISNYGKQLLRLHVDGSVYWLRNGEMVQANVDTELAQAFAYVVTTLCGKKPTELIAAIRAD